MILSFIIFVNNKEKIEKYENLEKICQQNNELFLICIYLQEKIIKSSFLYFMYINNFNKENITYSLIKLFQDIGFCIKIFYFIINSRLLGDQFFGYNCSVDYRIEHYRKLSQNLSLNPKFSPDLLNLATESSRIKDTIILGNEQFRNHIRGLNLPCQRITELEDSAFDSFFKNPYKENNKYKIVKYFVICDESLEKKYTEEFKNLSTKYGFGYLFIIYVNNLSNIKNNFMKEKSRIYIITDNELIEIYNENNEKLKAGPVGFVNENKFF